MYTANICIMEKRAINRIANKCSYEHATFQYAIEHVPFTWHLLQICETIQWLLLLLLFINIRR